MNEREIENAVLKNLLRETVRAYEAAQSGEDAPPRPVAPSKTTVPEAGKVARPGGGDAVLHNLVAETTRAYEAQVSETALLRETLRRLLLESGDAVVSTDAQATVVALNPVAEKIMGLPAAAATGEPILRALLLVGTDGQGVVPDLGPCLLEGRDLVLPAGVAVERRDGYRCAVEGRVIPVPDDAGKVSGLLIVMHPLDDTYLRAP